MANLSSLVIPLSVDSYVGKENPVVNIPTSYMLSLAAETTLQKCLVSLRAAAATGIQGVDVAILQDSLLMDTYRLKAEKLIASDTDRYLYNDTEVPSIEITTLKAAVQWVKALRGQRDAVYRTVAEDKGHHGRAQMQLLENAPGSKGFKPNMYKSFGVKDLMQPGPVPRAYPDVDPEKITLINVWNKHHRVIVPYSGDTTIKELRDKIDESSKPPALHVGETHRSAITKRRKTTHHQDDHIKPVGQRVGELCFVNWKLADHWTLRQLYIEPGTLMFFDCLVGVRK